MGVLDGDERVKLGECEGGGPDRIIITHSAAWCLVEGGTDEGRQSETER